MFLIRAPVALLRASDAALVSKLKSPLGHRTNSDIAASPDKTVKPTEHHLSNCGDRSVRRVTCDINETLIKIATAVTDR